MGTHVKILAGVATLALLLTPIAHAETLSGSNYQIENPSIDSGGGQSSSGNYTSRDGIGDSNDSGLASTNFKVFPGFFQHAYPGVPAEPTLTNTGGTLYNALDYVIATGSGQQTDTQYAIAISSDDFTTTYFIQADNTVGSSAAWQSYTAWGSGTGGRVTGLSPSTTYKIKVKARYGADTETAYSLTASATTAGPSLTVTFAGVNSGVSFDGETTTLTTSANGIGFGTLAVNSPAIAAHTVTVSTNATAGYTTTIRYNQPLTKSGGQTINNVSGTNTTPAAWPGSITTGAFGYHSSDETLCTGNTSRFSSNNTWAALDTSNYEVACSTGPVAAEQTMVSYKLEIGSQQPAGAYSSTVTYITTALY